MNQQLRTTQLARTLLIAASALVAAACSSGPTTTPSGPAEDTLALCSDNIDNNQDGLTDCADPTCANSTDKKIQAHCAKGDTLIGDGKGDADTTLSDGTGTDKDGSDLDETGTGDGSTSADIEVATSTCPLAGGFGCPCTTASDCDSGYCVDGDQGKICTQNCSDNCPKDWVCKQTTGTDAAWICLPAFPNLCMPCSDSKECEVNGMTGSLCVPFVRSDEGQGHGFTDGSFCLAPCNTDPKGGPGLCKSGYSCKELKLSSSSKPVKQCVPDSNDCACHDDWAQSGKSTVCTKSSVAGTCTSKRQCGVNATGQTVLSVCDAPEPATEVCGDNVDNDCNGLTDEPGAQGCKEWFLDNDKDGYGTGLGVCQCTDPGQGYTNMGGDCNDMVASIHPGAPEICNNIDDDCNGLTDESGAKGCTVFFHDLDGDGWGNPNDSACLCKSKQTSDWITQGGDCDDTPGPGAKINPTVAEVCDGVDNNCNGKTDEEGAVGCKLYYVDADNDTFGLLTQGKCLCAATKVYSAGQPGDCDDSNPAINPSMPEICDGIDNNCDGVTDGSGADASCPAVASGNPKCMPGGICGVGGCSKGWYDVNGDPTDGCECQSAQNTGNLGTFCGTPIDVGVLPDGSATIQKAGQILPGEGGDWYKFNATDTPDTGSSPTGNCDQYNVHISFVLNPGNIFVFDVYRGSCGSADQVCAAETVHDWSTSFYGPMSPFGPKNKASNNLLGAYEKSPYPEVAGECNCIPANAVLKPCTPTPVPLGGPPAFDNPKDDPQLAACGPQGLPGMNICTDNSSWYYVRVFTKPGATLTCDQYIIKFDNSSSSNTAPPQN